MFAGGVGEFAADQAGGLDTQGQRGTPAEETPGSDHCSDGRFRRVPAAELYQPCAPWPGQVRRHRAQLPVRPGAIRAPL
ncbi:hypothetical protein GCM10010343_14400 [Streptomyces avidinii]|nr:hypothetical protein GCM10010343_14400 [Streptomyces avidinii]